MQAKSLLNFKRRSKLPMIMQDERSACGHACILMIAHYWGHRLNKHRWTSIPKPSSQGISLQDIIEFSSVLGFQSRAINADVEDLRWLKTPAILHWNMNHFVVLKRVSKRALTIHDPALGIRRCRWSEVNQAFTGIALEIEKGQDFQRIREQGKTFGFIDLFKSIRGSSKLLGLLLGLSAIIECLRMINPLLMQYIIDYALGSSYLSQMYRIGLGFGLFVIFQGICEYTRSQIVLFGAISLREGLSTATFKHLLSLPLSFFERRHLGDIQSKFQAIEQIQTGLSSDLVNAILDGFMVLLTLGVMFNYSKLLSLIVSTGLILFISLRILTYRQLKAQHAASIQLRAQTNASFLESIQGILPIKAAMKERSRLQLWQNHYVEGLNVDIQLGQWQLRYQLANQIILQLEHILVVCTGAGLILSKQLSIGMLLAFLAYRLMLVNRASSLIQHGFTYQLIKTQLERLNDLIQQEPEEWEPGARQSSSPLKGALCLEDLSFRYDSKAPWIIQGLHLNIEAGEKIAITGPSGRGKSTLLRLMMGLERPISGRILIDNQPLALIGMRRFRQSMAAVLQDDALFSGSILDNISFFAEEIDWPRLDQVTAITGLNKIIQTLPMGYESLIGQTGSSLSGGQKQRLLLSRALYQQPLFLFMDEASSHLDAESEKEINQALKTLKMTQIIVAHRQETIRMADRVIEL